MPAVLVIAMSLNQIPSACSSAGSDQCAFATTNDRAANRTDTGADKRSFESAVVHSVIAPITPLSIHT